MGFDTTCKSYSNKSCSTFETWKSDLTPQFRLAYFSALWYIFFGGLLIVRDGGGHVGMCFFHFNKKRAKQLSNCTKFPGSSFPAEIRLQTTMTKTSKNQISTTQRPWILRCFCRVSFNPGGIPTRWGSNRSL